MARLPSVHRTVQVATVVMAVGGLITFPHYLSEQNRNVANLCLLAVLGAMSANVVLGWAGQISVANAAFLAVGGFSTAYLAADRGMPPVPAIILGALTGTAAGCVVGLPSLRLRGLYLVVATLAFHYVVLYGAQRFQLKFAGPVGFLLPQLSIGGHTFFEYIDWYYLFLGVVAVVGIALWSIERSVFGRAWRMIRDADVAASSLGIDVPRYKILAFAISAFIASLQGGLLAYYQLSISFESFTLFLAISYVAMVIVGGLGSLWGAAIGAVVLTVLPYALGSAFSGASGPVIADLQGIIYGSLMAGILIFAPGGIAGAIRSVALRLISASAARRSAPGSTSAHPGGGSA